MTSSMIMPASPTPVRVSSTRDIELNRGRNIGGEFPLAIEGCGQAPALATAFRGGVQVYSGRSGLRLILRSLPTSLKRALLPCYLCKSVIQAFKDEAYEISFFEIENDLSINLVSLERAVKSGRPDVLLFINYFGFPISESEAEVLRELSAECVAIEDCVHGSLLESPQPPVGKIGHYSVTSFRKYLPVPDGGLVFARAGREIARPTEEPPAYAPIAAAARMLRGATLRMENPDAELEQSFLRLFVRYEQLLDGRIPLSGPSDLSVRLFGAINLGEVLAARRNNFSCLSQLFSEATVLSSSVAPLLRDLPEGVSPLVFPVRVPEKARDAVRSALREKRIYCPVHWPMPPEVDATRFRGARSLSREILGLPIDQRYMTDDMEFLFDTLHEAVIQHQN